MNFVNHLLKSEEWRVEKKQQSDTKERERERDNLWLELNHLLNPPPGNTASNNLPYYSLMTLSSIILSILWVQRVSVQPLLRLSFIVGAVHWPHVVIIHKYCGSSTYLFSPYIKALHTKDELFCGGDEVSHYCLYYRIRVLDHHVCDKIKARYCQAVIDANGDPYEISREQKLSKLIINVVKIVLIIFLYKIVNEFWRSFI